MSWDRDVQVKPRKPPTDKAPCGVPRAAAGIGTGAVGLEPAQIRSHVPRGATLCQPFRGVAVAPLYVVL
jgi:hypothetical protein